MIWPFSQPKDPELLLKELESKDSVTREEAFKALIAHPQQETDILILETLRAYNESPKDLILPLIDIAGKRQIEDTLPILKLLIEEDDKDIRESSLQALISNPTQESLDIIISLLENNDNQIKQKVRKSILNDFGEDAFGGLIRSIPSDQDSPLYFEIYSLMEELDLFEKLKESFSHPDKSIREFHLATVIKFHRPDFLPLLLDFYLETTVEKRLELETVFSDYSPEELIPAFAQRFEKGISEVLFSLADKLLFSRFSSAKDLILGLALKIPDPRFRLKVIPSLIKKLDPFSFEKGLELLKDTVSEIRTQTISSLTLLIKTTFKRISDKEEPNKLVLSKLYESWEKILTEMLRDESLEPELKKGARRLFYSMVDNKHELIKPFFGEFIQANFQETYHVIKEWKFNEQFDLFSWLITTDPSYGSLLLSTVQNGNPDENLWRILLKVIAFLDPEDRTAFKKKFLAKNRNISLQNFIKDTDEVIRVSALEFASELKVANLSDILQKATKDPSPQVRLAALKNLDKLDHHNLPTLFKEALNDPDESVAFFALKELKEQLSPNAFAPHLVRFINSSSDSIREFALKEIAAITKKKYKANYNNLKPEVRKLAAKVLQKLDNSFSDQLVEELHSLDPKTRLQAALLMENIQIGDKGREALLAAMKDPSKLVRAAIVKTLGVMADKTLIKHLVEFFNDPDPRVRANTIEAISSLGDRQALQILLPFLEDSNNRIRGNAVLGVHKIGNFNLFPVVQKMLSHRNVNMIASGLWVVGQMKDQNYLNFIYPFLNNGNEMLRFNAIRAISEIKPELLKPYFPTFRKDPSPKIRKFISNLSFKVL